MRIVDGFVCIAESEKSKVLFGKGARLIRGGYESLETNGIVPFANQCEAKEARKLLRRRRDLTGITLARLRMEIAETEADLSKLERRRSLVVVMRLEGSTPLLGALVKNRQGAYPLPGAYLCLNGLKPFGSFLAAEYSAREVARQGRCGVTIATFKLRKVKSGNQKGYQWT